MKKNYKSIYAYQDPPQNPTKKKSSLSINNSQQSTTSYTQHKKSNSINNFMYKNLKYNLHDINQKHSKNFSQAIVNQNQNIMSNQSQTQ